MWRLKHKLFGWHYAVVSSSSYVYIRRVIKAPNGIWVTSHIVEHELFPLLEPGYRKITPLTWNGETPDSIPHVDMIDVTPPSHLRIAK